VGVLTENIQNKLALMGQRRGLDLKDDWKWAATDKVQPSAHSATLMNSRKPFRAPPKPLFMCATTQAMLFLVRHLESGLDLT